MTEIILLVIVIIGIPAAIVAYGLRTQAGWIMRIRREEEQEWREEQEREARRLGRLADLEAKDDGKMTTLSKDPATGEWVRKRE